MIGTPRNTFFFLSGKAPLFDIKRNIEVCFIYLWFKKYCKQIKYVDAKNVFKLILGLIFRGQIIIDGLNSGKKIEKIMNKICK